MIETTLNLYNSLSHKAEQYNKHLGHTIEGGLLIISNELALSVFDIYCIK